jgi:hypothetical protein
LRWPRCVPLLSATRTSSSSVCTTGVLYTRVCSLLEKSTLHPIAHTYTHRTLPRLRTHHTQTRTHGRTHVHARRHQRSRRGPLRPGDPLPASQLTLVGTDGAPVALLPSAAVGARVSDACSFFWRDGGLVTRKPRSSPRFGAVRVDSVTRKCENRRFYTFAQKKTQRNCWT